MKLRFEGGSAIALKGLARDQIADDRFGH